MIRTQPLHGLLDNEQLPKPLHALADKWRGLDDRLIDAEGAEGVARQQIEHARHADQLAMRKAVESGGDLPPGGEHEAAARTKVPALERQRQALEEAKADVGAELRDRLRESRDQIADLARPRLDAAIAAYTEAIDQAREILAGPAAALSAATAPILFLKSLDEDSSGIDAGTLPVPPPALADVTSALARVKQWAALLGAPSEATLFKVVGANGSEMHMRAHQVWPHVAAGKVQLVNPEDMPRLRAALGLEPAA